MKRTLFLALIALATPGCGSTGSTPSNPSGDGGTCAQTATGMLTVNVTGLPAGVAGAVMLTGPGGMQTVATTTTLASAMSGAYTVVASNTTEADPIVRKAYKATVSTTSTTICDGQTATIDVTYALIPTSNKLWWGSSNSANGTLGYASTALASTGAPEATIGADTDGHLPGAFDRDGNLWVVDGTAGNVKRYTADSLGTAGKKTPDVVLMSDAFTGGVPGPASFTFDKSGNMWIGVTFSKKIIEIEAANITASGTVTPKVEITAADAPSALAFDGAGNLWVGAGDRVLKYGVARLAASTTAPADLTIEAQTPLPVMGDLASAIGLAFDASMNLWVNYDGTFVRLTPADQGGTGMTTITPAVQIKADVLSLPEGLAFDEGGGLWFAYSQGKFAKFGQDQLGASSAALVPAVIVSSSSVGSATSPAFFPAPKALPMFDALP
ncbi:MAG: hypothetical protein ABIP39_08905 [Polyangiaceae bacterium]